MAFGDYHPCDRCGEVKTFYDASMDFEVTKHGYCEYNGYRVFCICHECADSYEIVIRRKSEANLAVERNLAYGLLWMMFVDQDDANLNLAKRARAMLLQSMTKDDQRDGIARAIDLIPEGQREAVRAKMIGAM